MRRRRAATSRGRSRRPTSSGATAGVRPLYDDERGNPGGGDARLPARARRARRAGAAAHRLGRQDHDLPQARRGSAATSCGPCWRSRAAPGPRQRRCLAATCRQTRTSNASCVGLRRAALAAAQCSRIATPAPTARVSNASSGRRSVSIDLGEPMGDGLYAAEATTWSARNGRAAPRTSSGGAPSSGCTSATRPPPVSTTWLGRRGVAAAFAS